MGLNSRNALLSVSEGVVALALMMTDEKGKIQMASKVTKKKQQLEGLRVKGTFKVWGSTFPTGRKGECRYVFSTSVGQKNENGEWDNLYIDIVFPKEDKIAFEGGAVVEVNDGFVTFYTSRSGEKKVKVVLLDYNFIEEE